MSLQIYKCNAPTKPNHDFYNTVNFGIPKGREGRNGNTIKGIVIHCVPNALNHFDTMANRDWRLGDASTPKTVSVHYAIGQSGSIRQYVCDDNIAWGFAPQLANVCTPYDCTFDWELVTANPTAPVDEYVLHIALESTVQPKGTQRVISNDGCGCDGTTVLGDNAYLRLVHLLAWLSAEYNIPVTDEFIEFRQNIETCPSDACAVVEKDCECADIDALLCDVRAYCERCKHPKETKFANGNVVRLYGENGSECLASQSITDLLAQRLRFNGGQLGIVNDEGVWQPIQNV